MAKNANIWAIIIGLNLPILSDKLPTGILIRKFGNPLTAYKMLIEETANHRLSFA